MSISLDAPNDRRVAELRDIQISGLPGIGCYTLVLVLHFTATHPKAEVLIRNVSIRLDWGDNFQRMIASGIPDDSPPVRITQHSTDIQICFRLPLSPSQVGEIESRRNGGDFGLALWFVAESTQNGAFRSIAGRHEFPVRQQVWIEALECMEYRRTMLFELPVPGAESPIGELVRKAQLFLNKGEYEQTIGLCRQAIEKAEGYLEDRTAASRAVERYREERKNMDATERMLFLREALKHATHLAVHHSEGHDGYSRDQANAVLGATISLLSLFRPIDAGAK